MLRARKTVADGDAVPVFVVMCNERYEQVILSLTVMRDRVLSLRVARVVSKINCCGRWCENRAQIAGAF